MSEKQLSKPCQAPRARHRAASRSILVLIACILALLCAGEIALRMMDPEALRIPDTAKVPLNGGDAVEPDPVLGWRQVPNVTTQASTDNRTISVQHNSLGLREQELRDDAPNGTFIFLGDSMVWGYDAEVGERFTELLQQRLPRNRMVNAGILGFGTDQELMILQQLWPQTFPKVVVLTVSVDNDRDDNSSSLRYSTNYKPYFVYARQSGWRIDGYPLPLSRRHYLTGNFWLERFALARLASLASMSIRYPEVIVSDPTEHLILMMKRTAESREALLAVGLKFHEPKLETFLSAQNIPFVILDKAERYSSAGGHWTPQGHRQVAAQFHELFERAGILARLAQGPNNLAALDRNARVLDQVEASLDRDRASFKMLSENREMLAPVRAALGVMRAGGAAASAAQPGGNEPGPGRARTLAQRAEQLDARISEMSQGLLRREIIAPAHSALSPFLWLEAMQALPQATEKLVGLLQFWGAAVKDGGGLWRGTAALLLLTLLHYALGILWLIWRRRVDASAANAEIGKALASLRAFLRIALPAPIVVLIVGEVIGVRLYEITTAIYSGAIIAASAVGAADAILAPRSPWRRLVAVSDAEAGMLSLALRVGGIALACFVILIATCKAISVPEALYDVISVLFVLAIAALLGHTLWKTQLAAQVRVPAWAVLASLVIALMAGHPDAGAFIAARIVSTAIGAGAIYVAVIAARRLYEGQAGGTMIADANIAAMFGVSLRWLSLAESIATGGICITAACGALVLMIGPW